MNLNNEKIEVYINNYSFTPNAYHEIDISNVDRYSNPNRKYQYNVNLISLCADVYINNAKPVIGIFKEIYFKTTSFFDGSTFKNVIFKNCWFDNIDIRQCKFINCQFIGCNGTISYIRESVFKKNCTFTDTLITIKYIDKYTWFNSKRYIDNLKLQ